MSSASLKSGITSETRQFVLQKAKRVLKNNWVDLGNGAGFTRPATGLYPYQWNWDSGLIAYGYTHYNIPRAIEELRSLFRGQWSNGFLPHIVFHKTKDGDKKPYTAGPHFWQSQDAAHDAPRNVQTSGITQPPVHAMIVWHVYKQIRSQDFDRADAFLREFFPKLFRLHQYFYTQRDPEKWGLVTIYHPWESGFDNSPRWDSALERITPAYVPAYVRLDVSHVEKKHRPSDINYDRYMYLAAELREHGYNDKAIYPVHPFKIKDKVFSSILYAATERLHYIAETLGCVDELAAIRTWKRRFEKHVMDKLWSEKEKIFYDVDLVTGAQIPTKSIDGLIPLMTGGLSEYQVNEMMYHLDKANFYGKRMCPVGLAPSTDMSDPSFNPEKYWRGPVWININWFLWKAFNRYELTERARHLQLHMADLLVKEGFYEYYSPLSGKGLGAKNFSWTAALAIDMLEHW